MKLTLSQAMKKLKELEARKSYLLHKELSNFTYSYIDEETPIIPDYDYNQSSKEINEIDDKVREIRLKINQVNNTATLDFNNLTIAEALIKMSQLSVQSQRLLQFSNLNDISRTITKSGKVEYTKTMEKVDKVRNDFELVQKELSSIQLSLDSANASYTIDVEF